MLSTYDPNYVLQKFVNLPDKPDDTKPAEEFRKVFGDLYPGMDTKDYWVHVSLFRRAWQAKSDLERAAVGEYIGNIFSRSRITHFNLEGFKDASAVDLISRGSPRPLVVDFSTGEVGVKVDTLLDSLASWLLKCHDRLAICERKGCEHPYYVKTHARQQFCDEECAKAGRRAKKQAWWEENRDRFIEKWRKQRKAARRSRRSKASRKER